MAKVLFARPCPDFNRPVSAATKTAVQPQTKDEAVKGAESKSADRINPFFRNVVVRILRRGTCTLPIEEGQQDAVLPAWPGTCWRLWSVNQQDHEDHRIRP